MIYTSTRDSNLHVTASQAILAGLAPDGGLFLPQTLPTIAPEELVRLAQLPYAQLAADVLSRFLSDYSRDELNDYCAQAYSAERFAADTVAPLVRLSDGAYALELFHGPTCAFKDFALQLLPHLLTAAMRKNGSDKQVVILVATSGDTGKAALEGFADVEGAKICVFFPHGGTSNIQKLQMTTQDGGNVMVAAVQGNFDDAQTGVKRIFTDADYAQRLEQQGYALSSANSINWGRLAPQIAYYVYAYCDLLRQGKISAGEPINICVPTGNFGNILAAYIAKQCGLPVKRLICASNRNNVLTDFFTTGVYDRNRPFYLTSSPSMDILISSNLERLLYLLGGRSDAKLRALMEQLKTSGRYQVDADLLARLQSDFAAGWCDEQQTAATIKTEFERSGYLCDTHTAVGVKVYRDYAAASGDRTPCVIAATADPFKFCTTVLSALGATPAQADFDQLRQLEQLCGRTAPLRLSQLEGKAERFTDVVTPANMTQIVDRLL